VPFTKRPGTLVAVFAGAFRAWHGAINFVRAMRELRAEGRQDLDAVLIGDGPEFARARDEAKGLDGVTFTGAVDHDRMPAALGAADIGVAPFDVSAHPPLQLAFYWSPLKVFEYMAAGLPVVAPAIPRLARILGPGHERLLYNPQAPRALADALAYAAGHQDERHRLGAAARRRVCDEFSWTAHCRKLDAAIRAAMQRRSR
jgi:glycosyltransferase involved in cell wall biosynthesis